MKKIKQCKKLAKLNSKAWECTDRKTAQKIIKKFDKLKEKFSSRG